MNGALVLIEKAGTVLQGALCLILANTKFQEMLKNRWKTTKVGERGRQVSVKTTFGICTTSKIYPFSRTYFLLHLIDFFASLFLLEFYSKKSQCCKIYFVVANFF